MSSNRTKRRNRAGKTARPLIIRAVTYDATRIPNALKTHWNLVDSKSVDASLNPDTRQKLRERARYEVANNSYAFGVAMSIANNVIGSGPRLQVLDVDGDGKQTVLAKELEWAFDEWAQEIRLAEKLRAMRFSRLQDGESFAILHNNPRLMGEIKLDISPIDCERVCGAANAFDDPYDIDGITIDEWGNPVSYRVLNQHPGGDVVQINGSEATIYDSTEVIHWYRRTTSEQHRGCTELAACLNLFAQLRRYTESVVTAAETAADLAMVFSTDAPEDETSYQYSGNTPSTSQATTVEFPEIQFKKGMSLAIPDGWKVSQLKAEQPATTYPDFKRELLGEIGRSLNIPVNIVAGDSSKYNYASGRLDHQEYQKQIRLDQALCKTVVMTPIFNAWWQEWALLNRRDITTRPPVQWYFDGFEHVDPAKEANAQATRLAACSTNLMIECGKNGLDWEEVLQQRARELDMMKKLGIMQEPEPSNSQNVDEGDGETD